MQKQILLQSLCLLAGLGAAPGAPAGDAGASQPGQARLLSDVRQLTFEGRRSGEGYFSADGSRMIFQSEREPGNPFYQMYVLDLETGDVTRVSPGVGKTTCGWIHPDGGRVLFSSTHEDPEAEAKQQAELDKRAAGKARRYAWSFDEHYDIYQRPLEGGDLSRLTDAPGYDAEGSWSPDGSLIAFASNRHAYEGDLSPEQAKIFEHDKSYFMEIYVMDADGANVRRLTSVAGYDGGPFFSPDGERIVWRRFAPDGATAEIWTMRVDGSDKRRITDLGVMSWAPFYHPSGQYIIFANNAQGMANFELYLVDAQGAREPVRVTYTDGFDGLPVFGPGGDRLAWASKRGSGQGAQIFLADWDHQAALELLGLGEGAGSRESGRPDPAAPDVTRTDPAIRAQDLRLHVDYLASQALGGRLTGSPGERLATAYVARVFEALGLEPAGQDGGYFQPYEFTAGVSLGEGNRLAVHMADGVRELAVDRQWRPLAFSGTGPVPASEVVFAGYGIVAPAQDGQPAYDAYEGLDVSDRWVMVLRYLPEDVPAPRRQHLAGYFELRHKAMLARERGARGLIVVSGPNSGVEQELVPLSFDTTLAGTSMAAVSLSDAAARLLLAASGRSLQALQDVLDSGEAVQGFELEGVRLGADIAIARQRRSSRNVLARLPAQVGEGGPAVMVGAHVDHIGDGVGFDSLARADEQGQVHPGADDNASGVAGMLEIAQHLADLRRRGRLDARRDLLFAAWTGEEMGLLGSGHYARTLEQALDSEGDLSPALAAYLNLDMIGRLDEHLYLQGVGSSSVWASEIERRNVPVGLPVHTRQDTYLPTDATSFYLRRVPILSAFTGAHPQYNTPRDTPETLNYEGAAHISRLLALIARSLAAAPQAPDYVALDKPEAGASRRNLRAYLGTIPEYGDTGASGVRLGGVARGAPAQAAGLRAGDVIVELAGRSIENIYDFTYALNALKVGDPVQIEVLRDGQRLDLTVVPAARE